MIFPFNWGAAPKASPTQEKREPWFPRLRTDAEMRRKKRKKKTKLKLVEDINGRKENS